LPPRKRRRARCTNQVVARTVTVRRRAIPDFDWMHGRPNPRAFTRTPTELPLPTHVKAAVVRWDCHQWGSFMGGLMDGRELLRKRQTWVALTWALR